MLRFQFTDGLSAQIKRWARTPKTCLQCHTLTSWLVSDASSPRCSVLVCHIRSVINPIIFPVTHNAFATSPEDYCSRISAAWGHSVCQNVRTESRRCGTTLDRAGDDWFWSELEWDKCISDQVTIYLWSCIFISNEYIKENLWGKKQSK